MILSGVGLLGMGEEFLKNFIVLMFYFCDTSLSIQLLLGLASALDFCLADPWGWPHPVQLMGWVIQRFQSFALARISSPLGRRWAGVVLGLGLVIGSGSLGAGAVMLSVILSPGWGLAIATLLLASCFAGRSLRRAAEEVLAPLEQGKTKPEAKALEPARKLLSGYVGRDTAALSESEIYRAVFETVTENAVDGVLAPLFFAISGSFLGSSLAMQFVCVEAGSAWQTWDFGGAWAGAVALTMAYKAASTLDSMVGYRVEPYADLGWFSAQFEDRLTWLPCRLAVLSIALISGLLRWAAPVQVLRICHRDAGLDASPNSGWSECVYAAALGVQVGGDNYYGGVLKQKPLLGDAREPITPEKIRQALDLTRLCFLGWLAIALLTLSWL